MLSFGGLLSEIVNGGSPGLTDSNPGIVKILAGFVFPVGLVMCVSHQFPLSPRLIYSPVPTRIVLQGQELLTSNMMVSPARRGAEDQKQLVQQALTSFCRSSQWGS